MKHLLVSVALIAVTFFACFRTGSTARAEYPKPSVYPKTWEFKFDHQTPKRVVVQIPGNSIPQAYWYMTYVVTNLSNQEQMWLPDFQMLLKDGRLARSDISVPSKVFDTIKAREKKQFLEAYPAIQGILRIGEDQAKDGVAIWPEPMAEMGSFSIFVSGLSGEAVILKDSKGDPVKDADGKPAILRKTLRLNFLIRGDEVHPGQDQVNENPQEWIMR